MTKKKHIAILGSTGALGKQVLEVIEANPDRFCAEVLTANSNADLLAQQALKFKANAVIIGDESKYKALKDRLFDEGIKVYCGEKALAEIVEMDSIDMVFNALAGLSGLLPALRAIEAGKHIALGNRETLVVAGEMVTKAALEKGVNIYPADRAYSGIFQCLMGDFHNRVEKIYLMANDGQLMNQGFQIIEGKWLFGLDSDQIEVLVHPQSVIQSMVQFEDGSMKAQMGLPDMKLPVQFAMSYPERLKSNFSRFDFFNYPELTFQKPDQQTVRNIELAHYTLQKGGNSTCVLNAANDVAVNAFLTGKINFAAMPDIIENCIENVEHIARPCLEDYFDTDREARKYAMLHMTDFSKGQHVN